LYKRAVEPLNIKAVGIEDEDFVAGDGHRQQEGCPDGYGQGDGT
jgi:hypothetical protein